MRLYKAMGAVLIAGGASAVACVAGLAAHSNLGPTWMAMILGVASIGAVARSRRAKGIGAADV